MTINVPQVRDALRNSAPGLTAAVDALACDWLQPVEDRVEAIASSKEEPPRSKHINDPIWRTFELEAHEVLLLDSGLLQRMRGVKQLGLANLVFPGANHDRFEHICGTIQAAERVFQAVQRNAERRRASEQRENRPLPDLRESDRLRLRLAALLHDVGHGPFSHAIEPVVGQRFSSEVRAFNAAARKHMHLDSNAAVAEIISVLIALSEPLQRIFNSQHFAAAAPDGSIELQVELATMILGGRRHGQLACLPAIISGQVDADKMDYMARDALHSGMPIEFDTERLLWKLEAIRCTPDNLPMAQSGNKRFAEESPGQLYYDLGVAAAGVGALEQMLIGRAFLYDRLYHHHKVRAADAMAQRMLHYAREALGRPYELKELYQPVSDDTLIRLFAGKITSPGFPEPGQQAKALGGAILARDLYVRAFAFRASFHTADSAERDEEKRMQARAEAWSPVSTALADLQGRLAAEKEITENAKKLGAALGGQWSELSDRLDESHVIVDLAENRVKPVTINVHFPDGSLEAPNLFFDPARWSHVYDLQKRTGYVFCHRDFVPLIALAAKLYFFESFGYAASEKSDRLSKTVALIKNDVITALLDADAIDETAASMFRRDVVIRTFVHEGDVEWPGKWFAENADVDRDFVDDLRLKLPQGLATSDRQAVIETVRALGRFIAMAHEDKTFPTNDILEKDLQREIIRHVRSMGLEAAEGSELGGGETDVIVSRRMLVENKITGRTNDPFNAKPATPYQANRYSVALCTRVFCTLIAYKPAKDADPVEQSSSIRVESVPNLGRTVVNIKAVVPYGMASPSKVSVPSAPAAS